MIQSLRLKITLPGIPLASRSAGGGRGGVERSEVILAEMAGAGHLHTAIRACMSQVLWLKSHSQSVRMCTVHTVDCYDVSDTLVKMSNESEICLQTLFTNAVCF